MYTQGKYSIACAYPPPLSSIFTSDLLGLLGAFQKFAIPKVRTIQYTFN